MSTEGTVGGLPPAGLELRAREADYPPRDPPIQEFGDEIHFSGDGSGEARDVTIRVAIRIRFRTS